MADLGKEQPKEMAGFITFGSKSYVPCASCARLRAELGRRETYDATNEQQAGEISRLKAELELERNLHGKTIAELETTKTTLAENRANESKAVKYYSEIADKARIELASERARRDEFKKWLDGQIKEENDLEHSYPIIGLSSAKKKFDEVFGRAGDVDG